MTSPSFGLGKPENVYGPAVPAMPSTAVAADPFTSRSSAVTFTTGLEKVIVTLARVPIDAPRRGISLMITGGEVSRV